MKRIAEVETVKAVGADKAYDSGAIREKLRQAGKEAVIPPLQPADYDSRKAKRHNLRSPNRTNCPSTIRTNYTPVHAITDMWDRDSRQAKASNRNDIHRPTDATRD